ncbi:hypothetical protein HK104_010152 [Borealophlyctis nickersoniae]|nr:hypothetical protein HK104_010152 [Borealophlyctis nickersoniae]
MAKEPAPPNQLGSSLSVETEPQKQADGSNTTLQLIAPPWLERQLALIANRFDPATQLSSATAIIQRLRELDPLPKLPESYVLSQNATLQLLAALRSPLAAVLEAALLLASCLVRGRDPGAIARGAHLVSIGVYEKAVEIAGGNVGDVGSRSAALRFLSVYARASKECAGRLCGGASAIAKRRAVVSVCVKIVRDEKEEVGVRAFAVDCLRRVSAHPELRPDLLSAGSVSAILDMVKHVYADTYANNATSSWDRFLLNVMYDSSACLIRNLSAHQEDIKKAASAFANIVTVDALEAEGAVVSLVGIVKDRTEHLGQIALHALRNALVCGGKEARAKLVACAGVPVLIEALGSPNLEITEYAMATLREVALLDVPIEAKKQVAAGVSAFLPLLQLTPANSIHRNILHHAVGVLCNLSVADKISQQLCIAADVPLVTSLYQIIIQNDDLDLLADTLACLANLCIDEPAHLLIASLGSPKLMEILLRGPSALRAECLAVLRNLIVQSRYCWTELLKVDGFFSEIAADISASDMRLQRCAIDIVWCYLSKGTDLHKRMLWEADCLPAFLVPMEAANVNSELAGKCFQILQEFGRRMMDAKDPWTRLWDEWKAQDRESRAAAIGRKAAAREAKDRARMAGKSVSGAPATAGGRGRKKTKN